jgi:hypothetical protein
MPKIAISTLSPALTASAITTRFGMLKPWIVAGLVIPPRRGTSGRKRLIPACFQALSRPLHNAIVCANRWFCWHRLHDQRQPIGHAGRAQLLGQSDIVLLGEAAQKLS